MTLSTLSAHKPYSRRRKNKGIYVVLVRFIMVFRDCDVVFSLDKFLFKANISFWLQMLKLNRKKNPNQHTVLCLVSFI